MRLSSPWVSERHPVADRRIVGDAALEEGLLGAGMLDLAEEIDVGEDEAAALDPRLGLRHRHARDHADHPRGRRIGGDDPTDGDPRAAGVSGYVLVEADAGARAGHRHDEAECVAPHGLHLPKLQSRAGPLPAGAASHYATAIVKVASAGPVWHETHMLMVKDVQG